MHFFRGFKAKLLVKKIVTLQKNRANTSQVDTKEVAREKELYHRLAAIYISLEGTKKYPFAREMSLACYRQSAMLDDDKAQFILGKALLEEAKFRNDLQLKGTFASPSNQKEIDRLFEESFAYFLAAEQLNHIEAKRLRGLFYINGWGVPEDRDKGFELVVESIGQENSWDKTPQIFAEIGLNKPEFFSALAKSARKK